MKRIIFGSVCILSAVMLYGFVHLAAGVLLPSMLSWRTPPSRFWTTVQETGGVLPFILSILLAIIGFSFIIIEYKKDRKTKEINKTDK